MQRNQKHSFIQKAPAVPCMMPRRRQSAGWLTSRIATFAVWSLSFQGFFVSGTLHTLKYVSCCYVMLLMIYWLSCWPADRSGRRAGVPPPLHRHPRTPRKLIKRSRTTFSRFFFVHNPSSAGKLGSLCISIVHTPSPAGKHRWSSGR